MLGEFEKVMPTPDEVEGLHNCGDFSQPLAMQTQKKVPYCFYQLTFPRKRSKNSLFITQEKFLIVANCFTRSIVRVISSYDMFVQICF